MPSLRRALATGFAVASPFAIAPVIGEFFVEWAKQTGAYEDAPGRVNKAVKTLAGLADLPGFKLIAGLIVGLAIGMWLDWFLRRREPAAESALARVVGSECIAIANRLRAYISEPYPEDLMP